MDMDYEVIVVLQYNIAASKAEQQDSVDPDKRIDRILFQNRVPGIVDTILSSNANIVNIQELRNLESSPIKADDLVYQVVKKGNYSVVGPYYYTKEQSSFALCTFYKRDLFYVENTGIIKLDNKICLWILFQCLKDGKKFIIANTHLPLQEDQKWSSINTIFPEMQLIVDRYKCDALITGDFNFFDDLDGVKQREKVINEYQCLDAFHPLHLSKDSNIILSGTFRGYPETDKFAKTFETMSRLDHGFLLETTNGGTTIFPLKHAYSVNVTEETIRNAHLPSDHLPCVREFRLF